MKKCLGASEFAISIGDRCTEEEAAFCDAHIPIQPLKGIIWLSLHILNYHDKIPSTFTKTYSSPPLKFLVVDHLLLLFCCWTKILLTFVYFHRDVALFWAPDVAPGVSRLRQLEPIEYLLVGEATEPTLVVVLADVRVVQHSQKVECRALFPAAEALNLLDTGTRGEGKK